MFNPLAMKVLIVIFPADDPRVGRLAGVVNATIANGETIIASRGIGLADGKVTDLVQRNCPFDLILHHCGASNGEYLDFLQAYRFLANAKGWKEPPIVLFSGNPNSVEQAEQALKGDVTVCAIPQVDLESNLGSFLRATYQSPDRIVSIDEIPWIILRGYGEKEYSLQLLSALLPFGVMWEFSGEAGSRKGLKMASEKLSIDLFRGTERIIAERVKELTAVEPKDYQTLIPSNANHATVFIDRLMHKKVKTSASAKELVNLASAVCERLELNLDSALQVLTSSTSLRNWNKRLSLLRDCLLD